MFLQVELRLTVCFACRNRTQQPENSYDTLSYVNSIDPRAQAVQGLSNRSPGSGSNAGSEKYQQINLGSPDVTHYGPYYSSVPE